MDPHLLATFVAVARHGSFSAAAAELGYTQSAVSQQVAALESDLGLALLTRRPVAPTPAGRRLLEHADPLLLRLRAARADVLRAAAPPGHLLRLAATPLALNPVLAGRLATACARRPRLDVDVHTCGRDDVAVTVARGEADLGLADGIVAPSDPLRLPETGPMTATGVAEEDLHVMLPHGHPLSGRTALRLGDLADARWLRTPLCPLPRLRELAGDGFPAAVGYDGEDVHTVLNLVAAGHGLTLLPASAGPGPCAGVRLAEPRLVHRVELLHATLPDGPGSDVAAILTGG
ncbi:LysR family transcriptional regulator [Nonomuraea salmonea]|uniref:LysR family transcriptional regulator n=2 Tax=Nonomuraea salmonea TaxID=46181 RepID=A0ABV5NGJ2_9ACTN